MASRRAVVIGAALGIASLGVVATPARGSPPDPRRKEPGAAAQASYGPEPRVALTRVEARVLDHVRAQLAARGPKPRVSGALVLAARELARGAALGVTEPLGRARLRSALASGLAHDPAPSAALVEGPAEQAPAAIAGALPAGRTTHVGAGAVLHEGIVTVVLLAAERRASLAPFPREVPPGSAAVLRGSLEGLARPRVFVALPSGVVVEASSLGGASARDFRARVEFARPGRYTLEVVGEGASGPEVAALFTVAAGAPPVPDGAASPEPDVGDDAQAEAAVVSAANATRRRLGLAPLAPAADLAAVARRHSAAMAAAGHLAHVLPGSGDAAARLTAARVPYRTVAENVARASTALGAHAAAEESPAHRANLLRPDATRIGVGIARVRGGAGASAVYLTELFVTPPDDGSDSPLTPDARVREALWRERERLGLRPLTADPALDAIARDAALAMHRRDAAEADGVGERALALRRTLAATDVFVASAPGEATRSTNLGDGRFRRVGVGVSVGDSRRFGAGRYWITVVYTD